MGHAREFGDTYLGLDIGTDSVGWAVCSTDYLLEKFGKHGMWGVRIFPEASTAEDRRLARIARRRIERRSQRLALLQELFEAAIAQIDPSFFMRLQEGTLHPEDKTLVTKDNLFADATYTDKQYHRDYPTIYHLRRELMASDKPHDVRLVYLALHHIIKYRGHFLFGGSLEDVPKLEQILEEAAREMDDERGFSFTCDSPEELKQVLIATDLRKAEKIKRLQALFDASAPQGKAYVRAMLGDEVSLSQLIDLPQGMDDIKVSVASDSFEEHRDEWEAQLGEQFYYLEKLKAIHDWALMESVCAGGQSYSEAKVAIYETHKRDLQLLKRVIARHLPDQKQAILNDPTQENNYAAYVGLTKKNGIKVPVAKKCTQADFHKFLVKALKGLPEDDRDVAEILSRLESGQFMPKATTKDNGIIPNQLHARELNRILENASHYLPFLLEKDKDGLTPCDKIKQILTFRIPYYVGPLNDRDPNAKNCWVERRSRERIYPWNFDRVVDTEASATAFITRMTAQCTYLHDQKVLPKNSILYSRYMVLNELNNLRVDGERIAPATKQAIYEELYMKRKRVTLSAIVKFFQSHGMPLQAEQLTGIDGDPKANLRPEIEMSELLGQWYRDELAEEIIRVNTLFGDDRDMLSRRLSAILASTVPQNEATAIVKKAVNKRYAGWGRLSAAFLTELYEPGYENGEPLSIMDRLWSTSCNLMELLGRDFGYSKAVRKHNQAFETNQTFGYHLVENLYLSPAVKRQVWQTLLVVQELRKVLGHDPKKIFVEMARGTQTPEGRKESRKARLQALYKSCGEDAAQLAASLDTCDESDLRRDRLYLYYTQLGRCMYTGERIDLNALFDKNAYDIDHIYPQSKVKDDSLDNRVLVKRVTNAEKKDQYPIEPAIREKQHAFWTMLRQKDLISKRKYERLVRSSELEPNELLDFIARQLVETRQSTKAVAELLETLCPDSEIVYVKAGLVSDFRRDFDLLKCREVNDLHHAKDAYLNIVVGNVYNTQFTHDPRSFFAKPDHHYNLRKMFKEDLVRGGQAAWRVGDDGSIATVRKTMMRNNVLVTKMAYEQHGQLFDTQLSRKGEWQLPMSTARACFSDPTRYGGYNKVKGAFFALVEHTEKKKRVRSLIDMPLHMVARLNDSAAVTRFLESDKGLTEPRVLIERIKMNALLEVDGFRMNVTGRTGTNLVYAPAMQLVVGYEWEKYIRALAKYSARAAEYARTHKKEILPIGAYDGIDKNKNMEIYELFINKLRATAYKVRLSAQEKNLVKSQDQFAALSIEAQCSVLLEILHMFACNRTTADLKSIGLGGQLGIVGTSRTLSNYASAKLIHQSVTGLFEKEVDLLL